MRQNSFTLPPMPEMEFSVTRVTLDAASKLNQNDDHIHKECEVYINLSGDVAFSVEDRLYAVSRGTVILTMPYEYHHCIYRSEKPHDHYWITFSAQKDQEFLSLFFDREKGWGNRIDLNEEQLAEVSTILEKLIDGSRDQLQCRILLLRFFGVLQNGTGKSCTCSSSRLPQTVEQALQYMDEHFREELNIAVVAKNSNVSVNTLERQFKDHLGVTPFEMLRRKRLFASMMHLKSGSTVTEAALQSGFQDYSNYIQLFRKQFGMTPGRYKKITGHDKI